MFAIKTRLSSRVVLLFFLSGLAIVANAADEPLNLKQPLNTLAIDSVPEEPMGTLILPQALAIALLKNPELSAYSSEIRAQEAASLQASLVPNPVFGANAANFGNSVIRGFDGDAVTLQLSQLIELGGKRAARTTAADLTKQLAAWDYEAKRADILTLVTQGLSMCSSANSAWH
ncbi:TolC family protein [Methylomonas koyamae]|uniref:TolC family protein n=1 Tax=Methylomonas koyamae TaxID=702114 RepID=UPI000A654865|nr:TolC family protein [Methylomonas koyamae]